MWQRRTSAAVAALGLAALVGAAAMAAPTDAIRREYDRQIAATDMTKADQVFALARWCYQNELTDEALKHAIAAQKLAPDDLRPKYLIYALKRTAAEEEVIQPTETTAAVKPLSAPEVTEKQVDAIWDDETPKVMNDFREVQAMMLKRCAAATCHGGNPEAKFALAADSPDSRTTVVRNFLAVRVYVNREKPEESPLLTKPLGGKKEGHPERVLAGKADGLYRKAAVWIDSLLTAAEKAVPWAKRGGAAAPG